MFIPNPYFVGVPSFENLVLDYIFLEDGYPLLFTCRSGCKLYLCVCRTFIPKQKWVISEVSISGLEQLVTKMVSVRDAFKAFGDQSCIVTWDKETKQEDYLLLTTSELSFEDLPTASLFLDDDDLDDAQDYVESLKRDLVS